MTLKEFLRERNSNTGKWVFEWKKATQENICYCAEINQLLELIKKDGYIVIAIGLTNVKAPDHNYFLNKALVATNEIIQICNNMKLQIKIKDGYINDLFCEKHYAVVYYDKDVAEALLNESIIID